MDLTRGIWRWLALVLACTAVHAQEGPAPNADSVLERVNHYRARAGAPPLAVNVKVQAAAQSHAQYMADTRQLSHTQGDRTSAHYTGDSLENRLHRAGVRASASGEVVGLASRPHPQTVVDDLVATVYHRLLLLSHGFTEAGVGLARGTESGLDVVFVTIDLIGGEGADADASVTSVYPAPDQKEVTRDFDPASETPNPMPARELVGQPVSIQAATGRPLVVDRFTLTAHGQDNVVEARVLTRSNDMQMPEWAATLVPLQPLLPGTAYEARFAGSIGGEAVERTWRFTTAASRAVVMSFAQAVVASGTTQTIRLRNLDPGRGGYHVCYEPAELIQSAKQETFTRFSLAVNRCPQGAHCTVTVRAAYDEACREPFAGGSFQVGG